ncbi:alkaline phosphatase family protein, partial [Candidatus Dojkabacteria bacterium]|nr:alkaline phosphatase family protein [Candidatus Dojkabacteria bacterium]
MQNNKLVVIGLDCASPMLVEQWLDELPNIKKVASKGFRTTYRTCIPPITVPAWAVLLSGKDPGELGIYGFRNRVTNSYNDIWIADATKVKEPRLWDMLDKQGRRSIVVGVPETFPAKKINGVMLTSFLTPDLDANWAYPKEVGAKVLEKFGDYILDARGFRDDDKERIKEDCYALAKNRFDVATYLAQEEEWDFLMLVEMGGDRMHHAFWKYTDPTHKDFEEANQYKDVMKEYYKFVDKKIGELLKVLPEEATIVIMSDHGAKSMDGALCINEWLIQEGYLVLNKYPDKISKFNELDVDWSKTKAWGWGGYYSRIFLNVKDREENGIIEP